METYHVAGLAEDPNYAEAEMLADKLAQTLPGISIVKHPKLSHEWEEFRVVTCQTKGFLAYSSGPIVWTSAERLVGDNKDFSTLARERYNVQLSEEESGEEILKAIAVENLQACEQEAQMKDTKKANLYIVPQSVNCLGVWTLMKLANIPHNIVVVDLLNGEQLKPEFLNLNPLHKVPVLQDADDVVVYESHAIMRYIINKTELFERFYPEHPRQRALIDQALDFRHLKLYKHLSALAYHVFGWASAPADPAAEKAGVEQALNVLVTYYLKDHDFIGANSPTIADISVAPLLSYLDVLNITAPKPIAEYRARFEECLPAFKEIRDQFKQLIEEHKLAKEES